MSNKRSTPTTMPPQTPTTEPKQPTQNIQEIIKTLAELRTTFSISIMTTYLPATQHLQIIKDLFHLAEQEIQTNPYLTKDIIKLIKIILKKIQHDKTNKPPINTT